MFQCLLFVPLMLHSCCVLLCDNGCLNACVPTGEMAESRAKRVRIKEMDGWTLGLLVDYIYTAEIQVTEDNVQVNPHIFIPTSCFI